MQPDPPGPLDARAASPPDRQARRHWYTTSCSPAGLRDLIGVDAQLEQPRGLQPHILPAAPALGSQPATIRIPHRTGPNLAVPPSDTGRADR
jgi:hypothetical protein